MVILWRGFDDGGSFGEGEGEGGSFGGVVGVVVVLMEMEEELVEVGVLVKKRKNEGER